MYRPENRREIAEAGYGSRESEEKETKVEVKAEESEAKACRKYVSCWIFLRLSVLERFSLCLPLSSLPCFSALLALLALL